MQVIFPATFIVHYPGGGGGGTSYMKGMGMLALKETDLGVAEAFFDA